MHVYIDSVKICSILEGIYLDEAFCTEINIFVQNLSLNLMYLLMFNLAILLLKQSRADEANR